MKQIITRRPVLSLLAGLGTVAAGGAIFQFVGGQDELPAAGSGTIGTPPEHPKMADRSLGSPEAPLRIVEYSSMTCPHCAHFHNVVLPDVIDRYIETGKVLLTYRDMPLDNLALFASMVSRCVPEAAYFPFLKRIFATRENWVGTDDPVLELTTMGLRTGVSRTDLDACLQDESLFQALLEMRRLAGEVHGVTGTPTFFLNGRKVTGQHGSAEAFLAVIADALTAS